MFETKGYQVIDLNFGFEASLIVQTFEECVKINNIQPKPIGIVSIPPITLHMELLAMIIQREYLTSIIEKKINLKYTPSNIFEERIKTFINNETIIKEKSILKLRSQKILIFYMFLKYFKALYNVRL